MQAALESISPEKAREFAKRIGELTRRHGEPCDLCEDESSLRVVATDCAPPITLDLCAECAPKYLRALAVTIERG